MSGASHTFWSYVAEIDREVVKERAVGQVVAFSTPSVMRRTRKDPYAVAARKVLYLFEELVTVFYEIGRCNRNLLREGRLRPQEKRRCRELMDWADGRLVAFMDAKLNVGQNLGLRRALEKLRRQRGLSLREAKFEALRAVAHMAFALREEGQPTRPGTGVGSVVSLVPRLIEEQEPGEQQYVDLDAPEVGVEDKDLTAEEDAEYEQQVFEKILDNAGLSRRERQWAEIKLEGLERDGRRYTDAETAARLSDVVGEKFAEGTVKSLGHRARKKVGPFLE